MTARRSLHPRNAQSALRTILCTAVLLLCGRGLVAQRAAPMRLTLSDAIAIAKKQGLASQVASERLSGETWAAQSFYSGLRPQISLIGNALQYNHSITPVTLPDGTIQQVGTSQNTPILNLNVQQKLVRTGGILSVTSGLARTDNFGTAARHSWTSTPVSVSLIQPIFRPRDAEWDKRQHQVTSSLNERQFLEDREQAGIEASNAFLALYVAEATARNQSTSAAINDTILRVDQQRYAAAQISRLDYSRTELNALQSRINKDNAEVARQQAEATLRRVLNLPPGTTFEIVAPDAIPRLEIDPEFAVQKALSNGSVRDQLEYDAVVADRALDLARLNAGFNATVQASAGFNQTATNFGDAYQSPLGKQGAAVAVIVPLVQWGAGKAAVQSAKAQKTESALNARIQRETISENARAVAQRVIQETRLVTLAAQSDTLAGIAYAIALNQYSTGTGNMLIGNLLLIQQDKDSRAAAYVQEIRNFWTQYYALQKITLYDFTNRTDIIPPKDGTGAK